MNASLATGHEKNIEYEKLTFLYGSVPLILLIHSFSLIMFSVLMWQVVDNYSLAIWSSVSAVVLLFRYYHYYVYKGLDDKVRKREARVWLHRYYTYVLISGGVWGSAAFLLFPQTNTLNQMIVVLFIIGLTSTAVGIISAKWYLVISYAFVSFVPLIVKLSIMDSSLYHTLAYIISALAILLLFTGKHFNSVIDISIRTRQEMLETKSTLEELKSRFFALFENAPVGIFYYDSELRVVDGNKNILQIFDIENKERFIGMDLGAVKDGRIKKTLKEVFSGRQGSYSGQYATPFSDEALFVELVTVPLGDQKNSIVGGIGIVRDLTTEVEAKEEAHENAFYDPLTKLPNRTLLMDRLQVTIEQGVRHGYLNALLFLDVDYFKHINDSLGHLVGDKFLQQISKRLIESIRTEDTVARLGGDEFVVLLNNLPSDRKKASEQTYSVAKKLSDVLNRPYEIESHEINTGVSIGIYIFSYEKEDPNDVLRCADAAMYHAKDNGRNRIEFYVPEIDRNLKEFMETEKEMRRALEENQFELYYQPQAVLSSGIVDRVEALIRWNHPQKGLIEPLDFIPVAEKSGLILKLGEWVIEESAKQMSVWLDRYNDFPIRRIAINISPIQFLQQSFIKNFMAVVKKYGLKPENFELELTENVILKDIQSASGKIEALKEMGVTVALDDFGTGYSSLSYLQQLPVSVIKIDRSFITNLEKDKNNEMIVKTILSRVNMTF
ncbi:MAG: hypothetical protein B5M52_07760 [Helicobacteraceae bacterium 4484_230]|nr:MAG: hypothetical protein B5M52_07760 [Helicobacteraceae bacterium 4484_230]